MKDSKIVMELPHTVHQIDNRSKNDKELDEEIIERLSTLKVLAQVLVLALFILELPWILTNIRQLSSSISHSININPAEAELSYDVADLATLPLLFRELANEGLIKRGDKALVVGNNGEDESGAVFNSVIASSGDVKLIHGSDVHRQGSVPDKTFDFVFTNRFHVDAEFVDRTLKLGGIAVLHLGNEPSLAFNEPVNYKIVYLRRLSSTFMAMRKTEYSKATSLGSTQRKLLAFTDEERKAALKMLEDVLLEPPRSASGKSSTYLKRTMYLPDLLNDSLDGYPRRVFIDVGLAEKDGTEWFDKNYPTRNKKFDKYRIETVPEEDGVEPTAEAAGMSDWLRNNVKEEEYVVMKAEAEVVEEMLNNKAIDLVDELFMECKPKAKGNYTRRAYWECLALYGRLRDLGVAVHQWWG